METKINLSENVRVSDPCYTDDVWCKTQLKNVLPGGYNWKIAHSDEGDWGIRISSITLVHENYVDHGSLPQPGAAGERIRPAADSNDPAGNDQLIVECLGDPTNDSSIQGVPAG